MPFPPQAGGAPARAWSWRCDACGRAIQDRQGYVQFVDPVTGGHPHFSGADEREVFETYWKAWDAAETVPGVISAAALCALPEPPPRAKVQAYHRACDPHPDRDSYWVGVERLRGTDVLDWCAHLAEKEWFGRAELCAFVRRYQWGLCALDGAR